MNSYYLNKLNELSYYLKTKVNSRNFTLKNFREDSFGEMVLFKSYSNCGVKGCPLGWTPYALSLDLREYCLEDNYKFYHDICLEFYGLSNDMAQYHYLFSSDWVGTPQESLRASVKRLEKFISQRGLVQRDVTLMTNYGIF